MKMKLVLCISIAPIAPIEHIIKRKFINIFIFSYLISFFAVLIERIVGIYIKNYSQVLHTIRKRAHMDAKRDFTKNNFI